MGTTKDLIGNKIGMLTILDSEVRKSKTYLLCLCECGNKKWIRSDSVKSGKQKSCGCLVKKFKINDLVGKKFGRLLVLSINSKNNHGAYMYNCKCDCGNECIVRSGNLVHGTTKSCGCLMHESVLNNRKNAYEKLQNDNYIDGTSIHSIKRTELIKSNTSGVTGVSFDESRQKWLAQIVFKGKHYNLGRYDNKEDAIKSRKDAEEKLHKSFLKEKELL